MDEVWLYCNTPLTTHTPGHGMAWHGLTVALDLAVSGQLKTKANQGESVNRKA